MPVVDVYADGPSLITRLGISVGVCILLLCPAAASADETPPGNGAATQAAPAEANADPAKAYELDQQQKVRALRALDNSLLTEAIYKQYGSDNRDYRSLLASGTNGRTPKDMETLRVGLRYRIFSLTDKDIQSDPQTFEAAFKNLSRDLGRAGSLMPNASDKQRFRELLFGEALPMLKQVLQNNFNARSAALEILLDLEVEPAKPNRKLTLHKAVSDIYIDFLKDPAQPDAVKVRAVHCIRKYLLKADAVPQTQNAFAKALADELARPLTETAYQYWLLSAMEEIKTPREVVGPKRPLVFMAATSVMRDPNRDILVRCHAAATLGRTGSDAQIDNDILAWAVSELVLETGVRFNQSNNKTDLKWQNCGWQLYLAFHHKDRQDTANGFLNRAAKSALVRAAYDNSLPIVIELINAKSAISVAKLGSMNKWVTGNKPAKLVYDPAAPPLP